MGVQQTEFMIALEQRRRRLQAERYGACGRAGSGSIPAESQGPVSDVSQLRGSLYWIDNSLMAISNKKSMHHPAAVIDVGKARGIGISKGTDASHIRPKYLCRYVIVQRDKTNRLSKATAFETQLIRLPHALLEPRYRFGKLADLDWQRIRDAIACRGSNHAPLRIC